MYRDKTLSPEVRADDLLSKMTLEEKFQQMGIYVNVNEAVKELEETGKLEPRFGTFSSPENTDIVKRLQDYCLNHSRLGIPMLVAFEGQRGVIHKDATVFPQCAGIGGSFNRDLMAKMGDTIGEEASALGIRQLYAPNVDIPRDPRWGRMQEGYGEDPYLTGEMGSLYVKGVQKHRVATTIKHFIAYGVPEGGINLATVHMGEREMREVTLEPFIKCFRAGALSVMPAYNELDGEPIHGSKRLLQGLLREELGFDGAVISDYGAIRQLHTLQRVAPDALTAGKMAIEAGVDLEAPYYVGYGEEFQNAVRNGEIDEALVDRAVRNLLILKFRLGLFEDPYANLSGRLSNPQSQAVSREIDEESILLLENDGILPLNENTCGTVAVIGNNGKYSFTGDYMTYNDRCISFYQGMVNRLGQDRVLYAKGCNPISTTDEMIESAVETAKKADTIFLVLGDSAVAGGGEGGEEASPKKEVTCGEGYDMHDLNFPPSQRRLFDEIVKLGKKIILVLYAGRPFTLEQDIHKVNAFMFSFGAGEQSGIAMANLIFGDRSPSAKLAISFPKTTGHIPCYYNYKPSARGRAYKKHGSLENPGRDYVLTSPNAWYPFGYGLSYTTVQYSDLQAETLDNGNVKVSVTVENTGNYDADESILLFLQTLYAPITPMVKRLRNFEKVHLARGEKKTVTFVLTDEDFTYVDVNYKTVKLPGAYKIMIEDLEMEINV